MPSGPAQCQPCADLALITPTPWGPFIHAVAALSPTAPTDRDLRAAAILGTQELGTARKLLASEMRRRCSRRQGEPESSRAALAGRVANRHADFIVCLRHSLLQSLRTRVCLVLGRRRIRSPGFT